MITELRSIVPVLWAMAGAAGGLDASGPSMAQGRAPKPDTVLRTSGFAFLPTADVLAPGLVTFTTGYVTPFRGAEVVDGTAGSGNQSYQGDVSWGVREGLALHLGVEVNDDPTWAPVLGERREKSLVAAALGAHTRLWASAGEAPRAATSAGAAYPATLALGLRASAHIVWQGSAPGLFNAGAVRDERVFGSFALALPLTYRPTRRWSLSLVPSVATLPSRLMGAPYYGTMVRLGAGARLRLADDWLLSGAGELSLGPGDNVVDRDGRFSRTPTWSAGLRWRSTRRVVLDAYLTNMAGVTPATRHLTLPSDPRPLYGIGITYTPSLAEPPRPRSVDADADDPRPASTAGIAIPSYRTLPPGRGRIEATMDARGAWSGHVQQALGHRFQIELLATRLRGPDAPAIMEASLGSSWEYRIAGEIALADEAEGDAVSWAHRVSIGRDWDDQLGYLLADIIASRRLAPGVRLVLNPTAVQSGGRSPVSLAVGARLGSGDLVVLPEWRVSFTGERPVWTLGLSAPRGLPGLRALQGQVYLTTAGGVRELGRLLADPDGLRVGMAVGVGF
jgi:hypothetical protein